MKNKRRLLIIEDNPKDRSLIAQYLGLDDEYTNAILEAANADEGLNYCRTTHVDCVVLDLQLPGMGGLDFILELSRVFKGVYWPIVVLTGEGDETTAVEAMKRGAQDYLIKATLSPDRLIRAVNNAIERISYQRAREEKVFRLKQANERMDKEIAELKGRLEEQNRKLVDANERLLNELSRPVRSSS
ncbi:MAG: response regulator [Verrucomicrobiota bacterium]